MDPVSRFGQDDRVEDPLARPLKLACGVTLPNRVAKAAMTEGLADPQDQPSARHLRLYQRWADGGLGLPVYHEFIAKHGEWLRLAADGRIVAKARIAAPVPALQPAAAVFDEQRAVALLREDFSGIEHPSVVDLGTGSGAIALAVRHAHPAARLVATDASADALEVARANADRLQLPVETALGSWWQAVPGRHFELALSNPPYIAGSDPHLASLHAEPGSALTPGPTGLEALDQIIDAAPAHLVPGGWLLLEHGFDQAQAVRDRLRAQGFRHVQTRPDLFGHARCSGGHL